MLSLQNVYSSTDGKEILHGVNLTLKKNEIHAIMGPNGSGKTTLVMSLMGHPSYKIKGNSTITLNNVDITTLTPEERARNGLFVSFQTPVEITGVSLLAFLRTAYKSLYPQEKVPLSEFKKRIIAALEKVALVEDFLKRSVNEGFSGGERKRAEIAQLLVLKPKVAILDEIDSGLDVDSLKIVAKAVRTLVEEEGTTILLITHYQRILHFLKPTKVHVLMDGVIKKSGKMSLVRTIEREGYAAV